MQTFCPNGRVIEIDCTSMTGRWCCLSNKTMPLDEIKYTEDTCNGCELIFQKQIFEKQKKLFIKLFLIKHNLQFYTLQIFFVLQV